MRSVFFFSLLSIAIVGCHRHDDRVRHGGDATSAPPAQAPSTDATTPADPNASGSVVSADGSFVCPGGSIVQGDGCACPSGSSWIANACQSCPGGSVAQGEGCACPQGTSWIGSTCQAIAANQTPVQPPQSAPPPRKRSAWIPQPPAPPQAPSLTVNVGTVTNVLPQPSDTPSSSPSTPVQSPPSSGRSSSPPTTVTYAECKNGMVRVGHACQCPQGQEWGGGQCVVSCVPTQVRHGNTCTCPPNTRWTGSRCELWQECKANEVRMGASCIPSNLNKKR